MPCTPIDPEVVHPLPPPLLARNRIRNNGCMYMYHFYISIHKITRVLEGLTEDRELGRLGEISMQDEIRRTRRREEARADTADHKTYIRDGLT